MIIINRRTFKGLLAITASFAAMSYGSASACNDALNDNYFDEGTHDGFYYTFWRQTDSSDVQISCGEDGNFSARWRKVFNWAGGKGWDTEGPQAVNYAGTFLSREEQGTENAYFMLEGSTTSDPVTRYHVVESYGTYNPANCGPGYTVGSFQSDGATYDLSWCQRVINPLDGFGPKQYFSVRNPPLPWGEVNGTITIANHFNEWAKHGENLGNRDNMILVIDAYGGDARNSEGYANLTISEAPFDPQLPRCGSQGGVPVCCSIHADPDRDGMGEEDGEVCTVTSETVGTHPDNPSDVLAAINVGGTGNAIQYNGIWYEPSTYVTDGRFNNARDQVFGGDGNAIFQSELVGDLRLSIPISNQQVSVELSFVESLYIANGARAFDVTIENQRVMENVDVFSEAGHDAVWKPSPFVVNVTDGTLNINIDGSVREGTLSSVLVRKSVNSSSETSAGAIDFWLLLIMANGFLVVMHRFFLIKNS